MSLSPTTPGVVRIHIIINVTMFLSQHVVSPSFGLVFISCISKYLKTLLDLGVPCITARAVRRTH